MATKPSMELQSWQEATTGGMSKSISGWRLAFSGLSDIHVLCLAWKRSVLFQVLPIDYLDWSTGS